MSWMVTNTKNKYAWPRVISDQEKKYWETKPQGKYLQFGEIKPLPRAAAPTAVKAAPEKKKTTTKKRKKEQPDGAKPDGDD